MNAWLNRRVFNLDLNRESVSELEADIFSGIPLVTGKQNRYESRDWDGRGKNLIGSGRDRE